MKPPRQDRPRQDRPGQDRPGQDRPGQDRPGQDRPGQDLPDLDSREQVDRFVERFYARLLRDEILAPIFLDVADIDLEVHLPHIKDYWAKLLLGESSYQRHTMNIHRRLHGKRALTAADFERWLAWFTEAVDSGWAGPKAEQAKRVATAIAGNMKKTLPQTG